MSDSAIPSQQKRTILMQECLCRLRNTQIGLGKEIQIKHINNFMISMKNSGYTAKYRKEIVDSTFKAFNKMVKDDESGIKPLYRDKNWNKKARREQKRDKKLNWYKNGGRDKIEYTTVISVPVTKGGKLVKELRNREQEINKFSKERMKFVEDAGITLKSHLVQNDPFPKSKCEKKNCLNLLIRKIRKYQI